MIAISHIKLYHIWSVFSCKMIIISTSVYTCLHVHDHFWHLEAANLQTIFSYISSWMGILFKFHIILLSSIQLHIRICSGNVRSQLDDKSLPVAILTTSFDTVWCHKTAMSGYPNKPGRVHQVPFQTPIRPWKLSLSRITINQSKSHSTAHKFTQTGGGNWKVQWNSHWKQNVCSLQYPMPGAW